MMERNEKRDDVADGMMRPPLDSKCRPGEDCGGEAQVAKVEACGNAIRVKRWFEGAGVVNGKKGWCGMRLFCDEVGRKTGSARNEGRGGR